MELILDIYWEKRRVYIEWKQIICAVLLAFLIAGLYNYINALSVHVEEFVKEQAVPAENLPAIGIAADILLLPKENIKEDKESVSEGYPEASEKELNIAVSYGYSETEEDYRKKSADPAREIKAAATDSPAAAKADDRIKYVAEAASDIPVTDITARNPNIAADKNGNNGSVENEKTEPDRITADLNRTEPGSASADNAGADNAGTDNAGTDIADTDNTGIKPITLVERFPGFLTDEKGRIAGYTDASKFLKDHLVVFPRNAACTGIEKDALKGLEADIYEIYIPANISYIAEGALDELVNLYFIEAAPGNPRYYSENGILYYRNGEVAVCPNRLKR